MKYQVIRAEIQLPYYFEHKIILSDDFKYLYVEDINETIIPTYSSIPLIAFEKGNKQYVEKILNTDVQKTLEKITSKAKSVYIEFCDNRITISIPFCSSMYFSPTIENCSFISDSIKELADFLVEFVEKHFSNGTEQFKQ